MDNRAVILFIGLLITNTAFAAGPFGLFMGMKKSEFKGTLEEIAPFEYITTHVPRGHGAFKTYVLRFGPSSGLCYIKAIGKNIETNKYGYAVMSKFDRIESSLKKSYGKNKRTDFLRSGSFWNAPKDWMPGLIRGERVLAAYWDKEKHSTLKSNLQSVVLSASGISKKDGYITIEYAFSNNQLCKKEMAATKYTGPRYSKRRNASPRPFASDVVFSTKQ